MAKTTHKAIETIGIDIGKNSFHVVGQDERGAIVLRQKWSRGQVEARFANMPPCLIGMEACVGAHHLSRKLKALGHDARLMPAKYVRPYSKGQKNDFRDAEAIAEAVQRHRFQLFRDRQLDDAVVCPVRSSAVTCKAPALALSTPPQTAASTPPASFPLAAVRPGSPRQCPAPAESAAGRDRRRTH